jgi:hypothetical protein
MNIKRKRLIKNLRRVISFIFGVAEVLIAISILSQLDEENSNVSNLKVKHFIYFHGGQLRLVIAVTGTIPLLPLEEYVRVAETVLDRESDGILWQRY